LARLWSRGGDLDPAPLLGGEHHDTHDTPPVHHLSVLRDGDLALEAAGRLDEQRRGPRVQPESVLDLEARPRFLRRLGAHAQRTWRLRAGGSVAQMMWSCP